MKLIQIFLPLYQQNGTAFPDKMFLDLSDYYSDKFGGATLYKRSPADGFWKENDQKKIKDLLAIFEIMVEEIDHSYWLSQKAELESQFNQKEILIRGIPAEII